MLLPLTPIRFLHRAADMFPNKVGVICGAKQFTYGEFAARAERLASALLKEGIEPGDRVAYISFNNHQLLEGYYGVVMAKGIVMPLNVRLSPPEMINIINHAGARMVIFENDFAPLVEGLRGACACVKRWFTINDKIAAADATYEDLIASGSPNRVDFTHIDENAAAELFYTSGSTGTPKGVTLSHRALYLHALYVSLILEGLDQMVDLHTIPLFHANGWGKPQSSVMGGTKQIMVRRFDPTSVFALVEEHRATHMSLVPTMANAVLNSPDRAKYDLSSLKQVMLGGAAASPELIERLENCLGCQCVSGYGLTETAPVLTNSRQKTTITYGSEAERYRRQAMAGWAIPGVEVRVVGPDGNDVPRDSESIGEVIARGDNVMEGYYKEPEVTAGVMADGWFHTGDMAVWDAERYVHIVDRKKEIIISGGENISSIEVEKAIFSHPAVFECAVVAAPDPKWGEIPAAVVVLKPGAALTQEELLAYLQERLGKFKLPRIVEFHEEQLPKTGTGKIRKNILREKFWSGKDKRVQG